MVGLTVCKSPKIPFHLLKHLSLSQGNIKIILEKESSLTDFCFAVRFILESVSSCYLPVSTVTMPDTFVSKSR